MGATRFDTWLDEARSNWAPVLDELRTIFLNVELEHTGGGCLGIQLLWDEGQFLVTDGAEGEPSGDRPSGNRFCVGWYPGEDGEPSTIPEAEALGCKPDQNGLYWTREADPKELATLLDDLTERLPI